MYIAGRLSKYFYVVMCNVFIFAVLFSLAELAYRVRQEGLERAILTLVNSVRNTPYSNLGTGNWVTYDKELGYKLNPKRPGINSLSVPHEEIIIPKPHALYRIVVLGDSVPWDNPGFVSNIKRMLQKEGNFEVINAAVPGYTAYQEVLFFKNYLAQTQPDLVIWTYCLNDNHKFLHRFDEKGKMLWTDEALESLRVTSFFDKVLSRSYILSELKLRLLALKKHKRECRWQWECTPDFNIAWKDEPWFRYETYMEEMKRLTSLMQSKLAIVVFPYEPQLKAFDSSREDAEYILKPQRHIMNLCKKYDVPCVDLFTDFQKQNSDSLTLFRDGVHLNKEGHELTASLILTFLHQKNLLLSSL